MNALLEIDGLGARYPGPFSLSGLLRLRRRVPLDVLRGVTLSVREGETVALIGESGSGKTTLGRVVAGLARPCAGRIVFRGERKLAMMFQDPVGSLSPRRTVAQLVLEPMRIAGVEIADPAAEVARLLAMVGLSAAMAPRYPHQLSGGQARRVTVAQALAVPPRLVICDEPTAGLDMSVQAEILNLMRDLQERLGIAYLLITHNLAVARHVSHGTAVMYLGGIVETGPTAGIFAKPRHPYTARLIAAEPRVRPGARPALAPSAGDPPGIADRPCGCAYHPRCPRVRDRCRREVPALRGEGGHQVACHFPLEEAP
jgi:peptide/nickel transport system ATP-binding protein